MDLVKAELTVPIVLRTSVAVEELVEVLGRFVPL